MKIQGIECGSEFVNRTNQYLFYENCLFVFWWGRKISKEIMGLKGHQLMLHLNYGVHSLFEQLICSLCCGLGNEYHPNLMLCYF